MDKVIVICLQPRMTMARTLKLYKLPDKPKTPGIRALQKKDIPQVTSRILDLPKADIELPMNDACPWQAVTS